MAENNTALVNGKPAVTLSFLDRGLSYGQGLFETLRIAGGKPLLWEAHLQRLLRGCQRLHIPTEGLQTALQDDLEQLLPVDQAVLKILVTAGCGGRGYTLPGDIQPTRILQQLPLPDYSDNPALQGIQARWCSLQLACAPTLAGIKHLNRLEQVLARAEWSDPAVREGIVCGADGYLAEGTMSNLFLVYDGRLLTPDLSQYGIAGIMRNYLIELAASVGIKAETGQYSRTELLAADEVFFCNSLIGIWPLAQLDDQTFIPGPVTRRLQGLLKENYC
ncbi:aminodeoxychorismate lyase [Nitrincola sp.]|uniref:aminodeoxychorismate lyase n=1 Tax=Nitrincola sp. TaxID=1926584 RepID=UPI003A91D5C3